MSHFADNRLSHSCFDNFLFGWGIFFGRGSRSNPEENPDESKRINPYVSRVYALVKFYFPEENPDPIQKIIRILLVNRI